MSKRESEVGEAHLAADFFQQPGEVGFAPYLGHVADECVNPVEPLPCREAGRSKLALPARGPSRCPAAGSQSARWTAPIIAPALVARPMCHEPARANSILIRNEVPAYK